MSIWQRIKLALQGVLSNNLGPVAFGSRRSAGWPRVRREHLKDHPTCAACGNTKSLEVHHKIPFHLAPELELDKHNLITLCGEEGHGCHYRIGHSLSWSSANPFCEEDASVFLSRVNMARGK